MTWRWTLFVWRLVRRKTTALLNSRHGNIFTWERGAAVLDLEIHFSRWNSIWSPKVLEHAWSYISEKQYEEFHNTFSLTHSFGRECCLIADVWGCDPLVCNSIEEERYTWWCFFWLKWDRSLISWVVWWIWLPFFTSCALSFCIKSISLVSAFLCLSNSLLRIPICSCIHSLSFFCGKRQQ